MPLGTRLQQCSNTASAEHIALGAEDVDQWRDGRLSTKLPLFGPMGGTQTTRIYYIGICRWGSCAIYNTFFAGRWQYLSFIPRWRRCFRSLTFAFVNRSLLSPFCYTSGSILDHSLPPSPCNPTTRTPDTSRRLKCESDPAQRLG
jgi:hypothetical protein